MLSVMVFISPSPVARSGANTAGSKSHCVRLPPTPVCDILPLCCKTIFFITSIATSLASLCIKNYVIARDEQQNNIQHIAPQDFYPLMSIPSSTEVLIDFNIFSEFVPCNIYNITSKLTAAQRNI